MLPAPQTTQLHTLCDINTIIFFMAIAGEVLVSSNTLPIVSDYTCLATATNTIANIADVGFIYLVIRVLITVLKCKLQNNKSPH